MLQKDGPLSPRPGLVHAVAGIVEGERRFVARLPSREIIPAQQAAVAPAAAIEGFKRVTEAIDRLCNEALVERLSCCLDLLRAIGALSLCLLQNAPIGGGNRRR